MVTNLNLFKLVHFGTSPHSGSDIWWWQLKLKHVRWCVLECCLVDTVIKFLVYNAYLQTDGVYLGDEILKVWFRWF